jgi:hypothetical protein
VDDSTYAPSGSQVIVRALRYDAIASQVVYRSEDGKETPCAGVEISRGHFGRRVKITETKFCTLTSDTEEVPYDAGFNDHHRKRKVLNIYLNVRD